MTTIYTPGSSLLFSDGVVLVVPKPPDFPAPRAPPPSKLATTDSRFNRLSVPPSLTISSSTSPDAAAISPSASGRRLLRRTDRMLRLPGSEQQSLSPSLSSNSLNQPQHELTPEAKAAQRQRKRIMAIAELVGTEDAYLEALEAACALYVSPSGSILTTEDSAKLFGPLTSIVQVSRQLITDLDAENTTVGGAFLKHADAFKLYSGCIGLEDSQNLIKKLEKKSSAFHNLLQEAKKDPKGRDLGVFLQMPTERLVKYPKMLQDIYENTDDTDPEKQELEKALTKMKEVISLIEEKKREIEVTKRLVKLQKYMVDEKGQTIDLLSPGRKLLREADVTEKQASWSRSDGVRWSSSSSQEHYLLFNDLLLRTHTSRMSKKMTVKSRTPIPVLDFNDVLSSEDRETRQINSSIKKVIELKLAPADGVPQIVLMLFESEIDGNAWLADLEKAKSEALTAAIGSIVQLHNKK